MKKINVILCICLLLIMMTFNKEIRSQQISSFLDIRDSSTYVTVSIGNQTWLAENLHFQTPNGSWCYGNDSLNGIKYGLLYNWETAKEVCPAGWHLPAKSEWDTLINYLGGTEIAGAKLKSNSYWEHKHDSLTGYAHVSECAHFRMGVKHDSVMINSSYFNGLPGGGYYPGNIFDYEGEHAIWWIATEYNKYNAYYTSIFDVSTEIGTIFYALKTSGYSVRCIKNE